MARQRAYRPIIRHKNSGIVPDDLYALGFNLYDYIQSFPVSLRHAGKVDDGLLGWVVTDDWPEHIPVSLAEVELFERWFGDVFDEFFGTKS